jgi:hypothetical protein
MKVGCPHVSCWVQCAFGLTFFELTDETKECDYLYYAERKYYTRSCCIDWFVRNSSAQNLNKWFAYFD